MNSEIRDVSDPGKDNPLPVNDATIQESPTAAIDNVCDEFEKAWRAGNPPRIEDVLAGTDIAQRTRLFDELLEIELDFLQRGGGEPSPVDYQSRYPDRAEQVAAVFQRSKKVRRLGDYELLGELGQGGMGVVYRARQIFLRQIVAVKVLPQRCLNDTQAVARFRREMQLIGSLDHPNIVRAFNAGETAGEHYLVMEYIDGVNLQALVSTTKAPGSLYGGPLSLAAACEVIRQAAWGLQHAHEHHMVHRDIKPGNIMINRAGVVKLLDLGLAKFLIENSDEQAESPAEKLTQVGMAMGTVDFMAPEQWENPSTVDIRSDMYSLGCTFFYLLTGMPPYGGPSYDTSRKKLMAHVVAPPPSLAAALERRKIELPPELEGIFARMMAKAAADRFSEPSELAEAIAEFADAEELSQLMADYPRSDGAPPLGHPPTAIAFDTQKKPHTSLSHRPSHSTRTTWRWKFWLRAVLGPTIALVLLATTWFSAVRWGRHHPGSNDPKAATQATQAIQSTQATQATTYNRQTLAADMALLPGLNGDWWFNETPWYLPFVRQAVVENLAAAPDSTALLGPEPRVYLKLNVAAVDAWLWEVTGRCRPALSQQEVRLIDDMRDISESGRRGAPLSSALADALHRFQVQGTFSISPADRHALALLQHQLSILNNDRALAAEAKKNYDQAIADYAKASPVTVQLRWLCMADAAQFASHVLSDYKEAQRLYEAILSNPAPGLPRPLSTLFRVDTLVAYGAETAFWARSSNEYEDHLFEYAKKVLDAASDIPRSEPLAAHIDERYAWSLMDQWKVAEAAKEFQDAYIIRSANKREQNPFAAIYIFFDRHGTALTARYRGNPDGARRTFRTIVEEATAARDEAEHQDPWPGEQTYLLELRDRVASSQERWADCELYGGAASGLAVNLAQACDLYESARKATTDVAHGQVLTCKLAMSRCLHGQAVEARKLIDELDRLGGEILGGENEKATLMRQVADALLILNEKGTGEGHKALRGFLDQFRLNPSYRDSTRRETLELQLFCAERLLSSELELGEAKRPQRDLKYLDPLLAVFTGRLDMRPFLRRFYELATRACDKNDLVQIAHYILESRMAPQSGALRSKQVTLVLFQFTPQENIAIFLPQDGRPGKRFDLDLRREQIQEAASHGNSLHLNDELVRMMHDEIKAGRSLEVSWSDAASRPSGDHTALTDNQWPFDGQIKLSELKRKAE